MTKLKTLFFLDYWFGAESTQFHVFFREIRNYLYVAQGSLQLYAPSPFIGKSLEGVGNLPLNLPLN